MNTPDPYRAVSPHVDQIWCDKQIRGRRVLILAVDSDRVHYVSTYSDIPGRAGFDEVLERRAKRGGLPPSMRRSRWKSCFTFESGPRDATVVEGFPAGHHPRHPNDPDAA